jgi:hypothetical protein
MSGRISYNNISSTTPVKSMCEAYLAAVSNSSLFRRCKKGLSLVLPVGIYYYI